MDGVHGRFFNHLLQLERPCFRERNRVIWQATPHCLMWTIWSERNCRTFEDEEKSVQDIKNLFLRTLFE